MDVDPGTNRALGYRLLLEFGFPADQWAYLDALWRRESGWNHLAENPRSGAYGIPQSLPAAKMAVVGSDWRTNPETQIMWGLAYIAARYGSAQRAWAHSERVGWY
ncbi:lytic transglycosylase domain-containing protein [Nocardioides sp.]|nr:lytic transglycosylase domain-containing protein [Nocardioides sp.]